MDILQSIYRINKLEFEEHEILENKNHFVVRNKETGITTSVAVLSESKGWYISEIIALCVWKDRLETALQKANNKLFIKRQKFSEFDTGIELETREIDTNLNQAVLNYKEMIEGKLIKKKWFTDELITQVFVLYNEGEKTSYIGKLLSISSLQVSQLLDSTKYVRIKSRLGLSKKSNRITNYIK